MATGQVSLSSPLTRTVRARRAVVWAGHPVPLVTVSSTVSSAARFRRHESIVGLERSWYREVFSPLLPPLEGR
jgi:hypothetical protein